MIYIIDSDVNSAEIVRPYYQYNYFQNVQYEYDIQDSVLTIGINIIYPDYLNLNDKSFSIKIPIDKYAGQYIVIKILKETKELLNEQEDSMIMIPIFQYPVLDFNCANLYSKGYDEKDRGSERFVSLYITKDGQDIYIHPFFRLNNRIYNNTKFTHIEKPLINSNHIGMLLSSCQEFRDYYNKWCIKKETIDPTVDISKSASYLEAEIDVLYKIIELLLEKTEIDASEYQPVIDAVARHNVLDIKNINKLNSELDEDKEHVRKIQEMFYKEAYEEQ